MARVLSLLGYVFMATISSAHLQMQQPITENISPGASFGYNGNIGPISWYGMDTSANKLCATGTNQSPINIEPENVPLTTDGIWLNISRVPSTTMVNNGHTIQVELMDMGTMIYPFPFGTQFWLQQLHFHTPSEHHINGSHWDVEMHIVFKATDGTLAVLGQTYYITDAPSDPFLLQLPWQISSIAAPGSKMKVGPLSFDLVTTRWKTVPSYTYPGSLTTPPCSENVTWFVAPSPLPIRFNRYTNLRKIMGFNARIVQNQYGEENLLVGAGKALQANGAL